eukprot:6479054-Amphidinium_carterae.2
MLVPLLLLPLTLQQLKHCLLSLHLMLAMAHQDWLEPCLDNLGHTANKDNILNAHSAATQVNFFCTTQVGDQTHPIPKLPRC